ncbi:MAG TPA: Hsp20/alpha crystallin family protein [Phycisphaerae bacterium]|nr:Hsp20/alpha crystallin family protein [Phycisphaerae bacterium]
MLPVRLGRGADLLDDPMGWPMGAGLVDRVHRDFDRLVDRVLGEPWAGGLVPYNVDVREDDSHYYVEAEMPGLTKDDIEITLEDGVLTISGEKKTSSEQKSGHYHIRERQYGRFSRQFSLPSAVDENKVDALLKDGVLRITLDKREDVKPRKITVSGG